MTVKQLLLGESLESMDNLLRRQSLVENYRYFFLTAYLCDDLKEGEQQGRRVFLGDPMGIALVNAAQQAMPPETTYPKLDEVPFDADRMRLTLIHELPEGPSRFARVHPKPSFPVATCS